MPGLDSEPGHLSTLPARIPYRARHPRQSTAGVGWVEQLPPPPANNVIPFPAPSWRVWPPNRR
ncbi:MAG: hypothetical protein ACRDHZ_01530, partial [Ktedonobacteraceae bacterium]